MFFVISFPVFINANSLIVENTDLTDDESVFENSVLLETIKSVRIFKKGFELTEPVIQLNSEEKLVLSFDDLDYENVKNFRYTIQHCNIEWNATDLLESQYLEGYNVDYITDYEFSRNTLISYIHYKLEFPNENMKPKLSGNYIVKVYDEDEEKLVLIKKFKVLEPLVSVESEIIAALGIDGKDSKQELSFAVNLNKISIQNPEKDIFIQVKQNGRSDNMISGLKPMKNLGSTLDYKLNGETVFNGGNEFRNFDTKSLKYNTEFVKEIDNLNDTMNVLLWELKSRAYTDYRFLNDINGKWLVNIDEDYDANTNADYTWVYLNFSFNSYLPSSKIFVVGDFTNWNLRPEYELKYDFNRKVYTTKLLLKQGYYNYLLAYYDVEDKTMNTVKFEGNFFETKNDYSIYVYYNEPGSYYYRLIGLNKVGSK